MKKLALGWLLLAGLPSLPGAAQAPAPPPPRTENLILVTLDGLRWQEVFGGADSALLRRRHPGFCGPARGPAPSTAARAARRAALMPFVWGTVARQGQLYGNRALGSCVNVTNRARLSYPGYNEMLTGIAADPLIRNNAPSANPNPTVLEFINQQPGFRGRVLTYGSWEAFPAILNARRSGLPVNAGQQPATGPGLSARERELNERLRTGPGPFGAERLDSLTFGYAFEQLRRARPRVLYLALGDPDDYAHAGHYGRYVQAAQAADQYLARLWHFVQSTEQYRDKTTLVVTTDHGRGRSSWGRWAHHGRLLRGSEQIWLAVLGPDTPPTGEQRGPAPPLYQHQLAATLARLLGVPYTNPRPIGPAIAAVLGPDSPAALSSSAGARP